MKRETGQSALVDERADGNVIGSGSPRGRQRLDNATASDALSTLAGEAVELGPGAVAFTCPATCPACAASEVIWASPDQETRNV
jgi:chorismate synthase